VLLDNSTLSGGTFTFNEAGSLAATNVLFSSNLSITHLPPAMTLYNVTYNNNTANGWIVGQGGTFNTLSIIGGSVSRGPSSNLELRPDASSRTATLLIDGGDHDIGQARFGSGNGALGQSIATIKNATVRFSNGAGAAWGGGGLGAVTSATTVNLENSTNRMDFGLILASNLTLNVKNSTLDFRTAAPSSVDNLMTNSAKFDGEGLTLSMRPENVNLSYEVAGTDKGGVFAGFHDNYSLDKINFGNPSFNSATTTLVDVRNNKGTAGNEALYVDAINLSGKMTFDLGGRNVYYKKLTMNTFAFTVNNGTLTQVKGADLLSAAPFAHQDADVAIYGGPALTLASPSDYGTVIVSNAPNGGDLFIRLNVSGSAGDINTLASEIGAVLVDGDLRLDYNGRPDGNNQFFDWSFAYRNVTVNSIFASAIPEPSSVMLLLSAAGSLIVLRRRKW
jgi:hypothetical protein